MKAAELLAEAWAEIVPSIDGGSGESPSIACVRGILASVRVWMIEEHQAHPEWSIEDLIDNLRLPGDKS